MSALRARAGRWLLERRGAPAILLYHRVAALEHDPQQLAVTPGNFDAQLAVLGDTCTPVPLDEIPALLRARRLPRRPVAVSFDDGYRDNLTEAKPLLERRGVPATVFVASGYVGRRAEFWWDELERLGTPRYEELQPRLKRAATDERERILAELREEAGEPPEGTPRPENLSVDHDELSRLDGGAVRVGSHTRNHLCLAAHPADVQREEIARGAADLSDWLGRKVDLLAYPFGTPGEDVSPETTRIARDAGHRAAFVNDPRVCLPTARRFALPRFLVRDWPADRFGDWLEREVFAW
jgi:peptidoglycan/xylan/chitin deacetylase (PgdA/CDA1 family)